MLTLFKGAGWVAAWGMFFGALGDSQGSLFLLTASLGLVGVLVAVCAVWYVWGEGQMKATREDG